VVKMGSGCCNGTYPVCFAGLGRNDCDDIEGAGHGDVMLDLWKHRSSFMLNVK
jgi:hypothetical protein